jgi:hypothetical protein
MKIPTTKEIAKMTPQQLSKAEKIVEQAIRKIESIYPLESFTPNPPQYKFFKMVDTGVRERGHYDFICPFGNGTGKTTSLAIFVGTIAWGEKFAPKFMRNFPLFMDWNSVFKGAKHNIRLSCESKHIRELSGGLYQAFAEWWPKDGSWKALKQGYDYPTLFTLPNDWKMQVSTFEQTDKSKETDEITLYLADEPPPIADWFAAGPRMRRGGVRVICATLCMDSEGIANEIMALPTTEYFYADTRQNSTSYVETIDGMTLRGKLDPQRIEEMIAKMRKSEREYRVSGKPIHLRGRAFNLDPEAHNISANRVPNGCTTCIVVDPHPRKPWYITVQKKDAYGNVFAVDEFPSPSDYDNTWFNDIEKDEHGVGFFAQQIKRLGFEHNADFMVLDFKFSNQQQREDDWAVTTINRLRNDYDLVFEKGSTTVSGDGGGIRELQDALEYTAEKPPKLRIVREKCPNLWHMVENVCWWDDKEKLSPKMDDGARSLMYGLQANWNSYTPIKPFVDEFSKLTPEQSESERNWLDGLKQRERIIGLHNRSRSALSQGRLVYAN